MSTKREWIFYLNLSKKLDRQYFALDAKFKSKGVSLIPVNIQELSTLVKGEGDFHIMCLVNSVSRYKYFAKSVQKFMRIFLQNPKINFYIASSFETLDESNIFSKKGNYSFQSLPCSLDRYVKSVSGCILEKEKYANSWPGARRRVYPRGESF